MIILIMLDAILIIFSVIVAIITGHEIDRLKAKIVELEQTKQEAFQRLREAQQRRVSVEATRDLLERTKGEKLMERAMLAAELEQLEEELGPEHEIELSRSMDKESFEDSSEKEEQPAEEGAPVEKESSSAERQIKVRQPLAQRPLDFDAS